MVISSVLGYRIGMDILRSWPSSHSGSLTCAVRAVMAGKAKWKLNGNRDVASAKGDSESKTASHP